MKNFNDEDLLDFLSDTEGMTDEEIKEDLLSQGIDPDESQKKTLNFLTKLEAIIKLEEAKEMQKEFEKLSDYENPECGVHIGSLALQFRNKQQLTSDDNENIEKDKQKLNLIKKLNKSEI
jgi:hypothetical protein